MSEQNAVIRAYDATIEAVDKDKMSLVARINTSDVDYYKTVIDPGGISLKNYNALGRPILWEHGKDARRFTDPIANGQWIRNNGGQKPTEILSKPIFLHDDFSRQRFEWYRDGVIKGWSVNVIPELEQVSAPTKEELRSRPDWESATLIYRHSTLAEFSGTVIPGNPMALTSDRGSPLLDVLKRSIEWLPEKERALIEMHLPKLDEAWEPLPADPPVEKPAARSGYRVETDGQTWSLVGPDGAVILSSDDGEMIERACLAIQVSRTWAQVHDEMAGEQMRRNAEINAAVKAELDLRIRGIV